MAINFVTSYSFSPNTTIASAQVNTNFSDIASVFQGLEGLTKSFSNLRVDATPTTSTDTAIKSYVDKLNAYRRPVLQYASASVVNLETGLNGTSGQAVITFTDGTQRTDSTTSRINFDITRNAALSGSAQSGLRTGLSEAVNTRYALYAVKVTDSSTNFVVVGDTVFPTQANFATLNSNFGTNGWVHLGYIFNGNGLGSSSDIVSFVQAGAMTLFSNAVSANVLTGCGVLIAGTSGATSLTYTYSAGSSASQIPNTISHVMYQTATAATANTYAITDSAAAKTFLRGLGVAGTATVLRTWAAATDGIKIDPGASVAQDIILSGFVDGLLGIGANPLL